MAFLQRYSMCSSDTFFTILTALQSYRAISKVLCTVCGSNCYSLDVHCLGLQVTVQSIQAELSPLTALLDASKGRV